MAYRSYDVNVMSVRGRRPRRGRPLQRSPRRCHNTQPPTKRAGLCPRHCGYGYFPTQCMSGCTRGRIFAIVKSRSARPHLAQAGFFCELYGSSQVDKNCGPVYHSPWTKFARAGHWRNSGRVAGSNVGLLLRHDRVVEGTVSESPSGKTHYDIGDGGDPNALGMGNDGAIGFHQRQAGTA